MKLNLGILCSHPYKGNFKSLVLTKPSYWLCYTRSVLTVGVIIPCRPLFSPYSIPFAMFAIFSPFPVQGNVAEEAHVDILFVICNTFMMLFNLYIIFVLSWWLYIL